MEFVQFHPTALAIDDPINHNRFLISEAVRGEGAKLCDKSGNRYMSKYDKREDLAPRDIVARANFTEMQNNNTENVYLDATIIEHDKLLHRFPTIAAKCKEYGIDITKDYIPVAPAAHYFMGGIKVDLNGETSIKNLFAIGNSMICDPMGTVVAGADTYESGVYAELDLSIVRDFKRLYPIAEMD